MVGEESKDRDSRGCSSGEAPNRRRRLERSRLLSRLGSASFSLGERERLRRVVDRSLEPERERRRSLDLERDLDLEEEPYDDPEAEYEAELEPVQDEGVILLVRCLFEPDLLSS